MLININNRFLSLSEKVRYFLVFFLGVVLYNFIYVNAWSIWKVDEVSYTYHIVDYSFGFCTKLLPGAIHSLLFNDYSIIKINIFENILMLVLMAVTTWFFASFVSDLSDKFEKKLLSVVILFALTGPCTFSIFTFELGMLDVYWLYFTVLFFVCLTKKHLYVFLPVVLMLMLLVHFSAIISYVLLFGIIVIYKLSEKHSGNRILAVFFVISVAAALSLFVYFFKNEQTNLVYSLDEFNAELSKRSMIKEPYTIYYDYSFYKFFDDAYLPQITVFSQNSFLPSAIVDGINHFCSQVYFVFFKCPLNTYLKFLICLLVICTPVTVFIYRFWSFLSVTAKAEKKNLKRFALFLAKCQFPITLVIGLVCSPDVCRWYTHAFFIQFILFFYVLYSERKTAMTFIVQTFQRLNSQMLFLYFTIYALTFLPPYS